MVPPVQAFVHAVANRRQLATINVALVGTAVAHLALSLLLVRLAGAVGALAGRTVLRLQPSKVQGLTALLCLQA